MFHDDFKIISNGRELPNPMLRLLSIVVISWCAGYAVALFH